MKTINNFPKVRKLILIFLFWSICAAGCKQYESEIDLITNISDVNSRLLDVVKCDEKEVPSVANWFWTNKSLNQNANDKVEDASCVMYGYYLMDTKQYPGSLRYSLTEYNQVMILEEDSVSINFLSEGKKMTPPGFDNPGNKLMFKNCIQDSREFSCVVAFQYDPYTVLSVRIDGMNQLPISVAKEVVNSILHHVDYLIDKN